jgi:hypothetical protein
VFILGTWLEILIIDEAAIIGFMPDTITGSARETREDLDKLLKRITELDVTVNDKTQGLAQRIASLESRVAELERRK